MAVPAEGCPPRPLGPRRWPACAGPPRLATFASRTSAGTAPHVIRCHSLTVAANIGVLTCEDLADSIGNKGYQVELEDNANRLVEHAALEVLVFGCRTVRDEVAQLSVRDTLVAQRSSNLVIEKIEFGSGGI